MKFSATFPFSDLQTDRLLELIERFNHLQVLVIGDAILDHYLQGEAVRLCREAPVPIVAVAQAQAVPGGAANTAANAASLGAQTFFLSVVGCDRNRESLQSALHHFGVNTDDWITDPNRATLVKQRLLAADQLLIRFDQGSVDPIEGAIEAQLIERLQRRFPQCDAVIVSDYAYGIMTPRVLSTLQQLQAQYPRILVADAKQLDRYAQVGVTAVKPNYEEAIRLLGLEHTSGYQRIEQITQHGQSILNKTGAQMAAITLDVEGALTFLRDTPPLRTYAQPAPGSHATGAGDTYVATLALALAAGANPHGASALAAAATAITITESGTTCCSPIALRQSLARSNKHITNPAELTSVIAQHRTLGQRIVFTNGCFDILHSGHVTCLEQARALGDILIVGVNSDESIRQLKGSSRPVNSLDDRLTVLAALSCVNYVIPFGERSPRTLIQQICPDIYAKGGDYSRHTLPETPLIEELGGEVVILPYLHNRSTTQLIEKIQAPVGE